MNFIDDKEKMQDFKELSKDDFLKSYSYLSEKDYEETRIKMEKEDIITFLKDSADYSYMELDYILEDKKDKTKSYAVASDCDEMIEINLSTHEVSNIAEWAYSIDSDIFGMLEENKDISYMSMQVHYGIWCQIDKYYPEEIEYKNGMQKYLKYCKENNIDKKTIDERMNIDTPDVMKIYKKILKDKKEKER